jgi:hypothetical protein
MTADDDSPRPPRRRSITKQQRATVAGAELIQLCQTVTEDGALADDEIEALRQWLLDHRETDLPAREHLYSVVESIIADGRITYAERMDLYRAIEAILPSDLRAAVRGRRTARDAADREARRVQAAGEKEAKAQARERNRPLGQWNFMVAGCRYEGRPQVIEDYASPGDQAYLVRDRQNRFSRHAVEIRLPNGMQIGFAPEDDAIEIAPLLDEGLPHVAFITKILTGGRSPIPVVNLHLYRADAEVADLTFERDVPAKQLQGLRSGAGCAVAFGLLAGGTLLGYIAMWA